MKKVIHSILFLMCCCSTVIYGNEHEIPEACDQSSNCPRDKHPVGEDCPHQPS